MEAKYDVVVIGGGAAGLGGALALARARRSVLVIDGGQPRNAPADHVHNYLAREGISPPDLLAAGRDEVTGYGGHLATGQVQAVSRQENEFLVTLDDGHSTRARRLLVTTGLVDELPDVPGLTQRWGKDVLHCPYCHGWEARDKRIGILGTGPVAFHLAHLWRQWSPHVMLLLHDMPKPDKEQAEQLAAREIVVVDGEAAELEVADDTLTGVRLASGEIVELDFLAVAPRFTARAGLLEQLGCKTVEVQANGHVFGSQVAADPNGATDVPGVWVAGNVADIRAQVIVAAAAGLNAAASINADLVTEDTRDAVDGYRQRVATMFTEEAWEQRYSAKPMVWSGRPNPQLITEVSGLAPGRALDVGCGEGADAIWLAQNGWRVTAVDISTTALQRAAGHAAAAGGPVAQRIDWVQADLLRQPLVEGPIAEGTYDLVSAQFMHVPSDVRRILYGRLAAAVAPGGTLLIVGHHPTDLRTSAHRMHFPDMMFTAEQLIDEIGLAAWQIAVAQTRARSVINDGNEITIHDAVLVARRPL